MPGGVIHSAITAQALLSNGISDAEMLARVYCSYPDHYFDHRHDEVAPYMFFCDGIQFHYPPHTPVEEFYRYWDRNEQGNYPFTTRPNDNIRHSEAGFRFYFDKVIALLRENDRAEAWKYLGCLLHFLEDAVFGIHALEGADGTDIFVLDRLSGSNVTKILSGIELPEKCYTQTVEPHVMADTVDEAVSLLYSRYVRGTAQSRLAVFDQAVEILYGTGKCSLEENMEKMFLTALSLVADTIATIIAIAENTAPRAETRKLSDFSPCHYPIGGAGGFALRRFEEQDNVISFGTNSTAQLLYNIPVQVYSRFTAEVYADDITQATLHLINNGSTIRSVELEKNKEILIEISGPGGSFGFKITSTAASGKIEIRNGFFSK